MGTLSIPWFHSKKIDSKILIPRFHGEVFNYRWELPRTIEVAIDSSLIVSSDLWESSCQLWLGRVLFGWKVLNGHFGNSQAISFVQSVNEFFQFYIYLKHHRFYLAY